MSRFGIAALAAVLLLTSSSAQAPAPESSNSVYFSHPIGLLPMPGYRLGFSAGYTQGDNWTISAFSMTARQWMMVNTGQGGMRRMEMPSGFGFIGDVPPPPVFGAYDLPVRDTATVPVTLFGEFVSSHDPRLPNAVAGDFRTFVPVP
jgi:hypothetical protein